MIDFSKIKLTSGWAMDREKFSTHAREVFEFAIPYRRQDLKLGDDTIRGTRFNSNDSVFIRIESMFTEEEFMACPGMRIDSALVDAAKSDYWYQYEKRYDDEHYGEYSGEDCEMEDE